MWECGNKFLYLEGVGGVCRPQNNGSEI